MKELDVFGRTPTRDLPNGDTGLFRRVRIEEIVAGVYVRPCIQKVPVHPRVIQRRADGTWKRRST